VYFIAEFTGVPIVTATASEDHMQSLSRGFAGRAVRGKRLLPEMKW
jgi:hypothetical protein